MNRTRVLRGGWLLLALCVTVAGAAPRRPEFALRDLQGKVHRLSDYRGKWVIVNYWATSCPPCRREIPELSRFHDAHKDRDAVVLGLDHEEMPDLWLKEFVRQMKPSYPILKAGSATLTPFGPVRVLPTTFIVRPDGTLLGRHQGMVTAEALERFLAAQEKAAAKAKTKKDP
ncbi:MAG: TlpA family protein disulfide reductase [Gammaproteobacteria bacterium]|nr:MAG: TlpA family protein disulfide reductase [Gammaproteobacteria bacterium]